MPKSFKEEIVSMKGGKCQLCGYNSCAAALHFHHVNPFEKKFNISDKNKITWELVEELDKCILVCNRCHSECHQGLYDLEYLADLLFDTKLIV